MDNETVMTSCRLATLADIPSILEITRESVALMNLSGNFQWNDTYPLSKDFEKDVNDQTLWVAESNDKVVLGFAALTTDQPDEYKNVGWNVAETCIVPHRLAVSPKARGQGVAQALMLQAEILSNNNGYKQIRVDTNSINTNMQGVFTKLGYTLTGQTNLSGKPTDMIFNCYEKTLQQ